ncbi:hypothetical protein JCM10914A_43040 [Paenibacillus sp. JCM 10914]|uniref:spore germination protein n=1 Tax=Paenibacillus sp. JCM 10914 TaxID=1236974 RepID=UPI0003CC759C|nr:spore germination protein [Paenibacillus sp. JCM 10914]GAE05523.1 spore germination protein GerKA [Paenibacillus sp. JCM 10914]
MGLVEDLRAYFSNHSDYTNMEIHLLGYNLQLFALDTLVDIPQTISMLNTQVQDLKGQASYVGALLPKIGDAMNADVSAIAAEVLQGNLVLFEPSSEYCCTLQPLRIHLTRTIGIPQTENVLYGSSSSFLEDVQTNIGILRKHSTGISLKTEAYTVGDQHPKTLLLFYLEDQVHPQLLNNTRQRIESGKHQDISHLQHLEKLLQESRWSFLSKFNVTELPQNAAHALQQGKIVLMIDQFPFAVILPSLAVDMFCMKDDHNYPLPIMYLIRFLRIIGILSATIIPGLYVALVSVNPEVLRLQLALSIAHSRYDVPYPALVETILLLIVLELVLEASVRLPKSVGPTITMVGGIILGQAAVAAKLVSSLLIIVLAGTTIASSAVVGFQNSVSIKVFKYVLIILSAIYGLLGLLTGIVVICAYMAYQHSLGIPYLSWPRLNQKDGQNG